VTLVSHRTALLHVAQCAPCFRSLRQALFELADELDATEYDQDQRAQLLLNTAEIERPLEGPYGRTIN
jgi:hypothetical protein